MEVGQRVYVQKDELAFHRWYEAHIVEIHVKNPTASQGTCGWHLYNILTCCSKIYVEYVVRYPDDTTQVVPFDRIMEYI